MESAGKGRQPSFEEIELFIEKVRNVVNLNHSRGLVLSKFDHLLSLLISTHNPLLIESSFIEFFPLYTKLLGWYHPGGQKPSRTKQLLRNARTLYSLPSGEFKTDELKEKIVRLKREFKQIISFLRGENRLILGEVPLFPVIESIEDKIIFTYLDILQIKLSPTKSENRFIIHPTYKDEDALLVAQIKTSFEAALNLVTPEKKKSHPFFEVQVFFASMLGIYSGNSFGSLLTLHFYLELTRYYNANLVLELAPGFAITGATDESGVINGVGSINIMRKTQSVFFSGVTRFIVPKADEMTALATVSKLQTRWPERNLEIMAVNNVAEIINRRDILKISRKPIRERIKEGARKYRYTSIILPVLLFSLVFLFARELDTNPASFELDKTDLKIKNKFGAVLWSWVVHPSIFQNYTVQELGVRVRIIDLDGDGMNEVLTAGDILDNFETDSKEYMYCFKSKEEEVWRVSVHDTVSSSKEKNIPSVYSIKVIDTISTGGKPLLLLWGNNSHTYTAVIFAVDPLTGERKGKSVWNASFIYQVALADVDFDGTKEVVFFALDNGLKIARILSVKYPFDEEMIETRPDYFLYGKKTAKPSIEILLPPTDWITNFTNANTVFFMERYLSPGNNKIVFLSRFSHSLSAPMYNLSLNLQTREVDFFIEGIYKAERDSLVKIGKLPLPTTDTKEYTDILKNGVRYKLDGKWVKYDEYLKAQKEKKQQNQK